MDGELLRDLRESTATAHRRVESLSPLDIERPTREDYTAFLSAMRAFVAPSERVLADWPGWEPFAPPLAQRLEDDLSELDEATARSDDDDAFTAPGSAAEAWGLAYVLEGSRLGSGLVADKVNRRIPDLPMRFLDTTRERGRWSRFRRRLTAAAPDRAAAIGAALRAFDELARWMATNDS